MEAAQSSRRCARGSRHAARLSPLVILGLATAALAQQPAPERRGAGQEIIVTGQREVREEAARRFVNHVTVRVEGQLARFHDPICPGVAGLQPEPAAEIAERLRAVAAQAGVRTADRDCEPNVLLLVAQNSEDALDQLQKRGALRSLSDTERRRLSRSEGPVRAFSDTELQNDDGTGPGSSTNTSAGVGSSVGLPIPVTQAGTQKNLGVRTGSMINLPTQQATLRTVLIFEAPALMGKSPTQIADYAAMWAIGGTRPDRSASFGGESILSLFEEGGSAPPGLTALDLAYLKGVYATKPNQEFRKQIQHIADSMVTKR